MGAGGQFKSLVEAQQSQVTEEAEVTETPPELAALVAEVEVEIDDDVSLARDALAVLLPLNRQICAARSPCSSEALASPTFHACGSAGPFLYSAAVIVAKNK